MTMFHIITVTVVLNQRIDELIDRYDRTWIGRTVADNNASWMSESVCHDGMTLMTGCCNAVCSVYAHWSCDM